MIIFTAVWQRFPLSFLVDYEATWQSPKGRPTQIFLGCKNGDNTAGWDKNATGMGGMADKIFKTYCSSEKVHVL